VSLKDLIADVNVNEICEHILSLSYGKDSLACLGAIDQLGWPLDRIVHAEVWATETIPADLPPMVEFKYKADQIIKERWGIEVEHFFAQQAGEKKTYENTFYRKVSNRAMEKRRHNPNYTKRGIPRGIPDIYGFPATLKGSWCVGEIKISAIRKCRTKDSILYLGIANDETNRFHNLSDTKKSPLVEVGWTEEDCRKWCEKNDLLSPIYTTATRGGCWFCHNQSVGQLRLLRKNNPDLWALMLKWDKDSPVTFHADGHTVHDFDRRFQLEDEGVIYPDDRVFRWSMLEEELNYRLF